eukprot:TRINITY_DN12789_c0_g3_i5.p3 TRINITY_DN12789_c0_g3~~TRINITY_DN12789_c0_g3_i5.p3  ORF type:complete len:128 (+),score=31.03 TRINITY_DN12789_c0_g3_i5:315-698(+)
MYKCPTCFAEYSQADAYLEKIMCTRCSDTKLVLDTKYNKMLEGAKKGEEFVKKLTEMIKGLEDATLPESFLVNRKAIAELGNRIIGKKRKKRDTTDTANREVKIRIVPEATGKYTPIIYKVTIESHH